jgi:hypothetical protein
VFQREQKAILPAILQQYPRFFTFVCQVPNRCYVDVNRNRAIMFKLPLDPIAISHQKASFRKLQTLPVLSTPLATLLQYRPLDHPHRQLQSQLSTQLGLVEIQASTH